MHARSFRLRKLLLAPTSHDRNWETEDSSESEDSLRNSARLIRDETRFQTRLYRKDYCMETRGPTAKPDSAFLVPGLVGIVGEKQGAAANGFDQRARDFRTYRGTAQASSDGPAAANIAGAMNHNCTFHR